jgi:hypothetical protein
LQKYYFEERYVGVLRAIAKGVKVVDLASGERLQVSREAVITKRRAMTAAGR